MQFLFEVITSFKATRGLSLKGIEVQLYENEASPNRNSDLKKINAGYNKIKTFQIAVGKNRATVILSIKKSKSKPTILVKTKDSQYKRVSGFSKMSNTPLQDKCLLFCV